MANGIVYALLVGRVVEWNRFVKSVVYGLAIAAIALGAMPALSEVLGGGATSAQNPCGGGKNPCNPCSARQAAAASNPCAVKQDATAAANPQSAAANPVWQEGPVVCVLASSINREDLIALAYAKAMG